MVDALQSSRESLHGAVPDSPKILCLFRVVGVKGLRIRRKIDGLIGLIHANLASVHQEHMTWTRLCLVRGHLGEFRVAQWRELSGRFN